MQQYINANKSRLRNDMDPRKQLKLLNDDFLKVIKKFIELPKVPSVPVQHQQKSVVQPFPATNFASVAPVNVPLVKPTVAPTISPRYQPSIPIQHSVQYPVQQHQTQVTYYDEQEYETVISDDDDEWCTKVEDIDTILNVEDMTPIVVDPRLLETQKQETVPVPVYIKEPQDEPQLQESVSVPVATKEPQDEPQKQEPVPVPQERVEPTRTTTESTYDDLPLLNL